VDRRNLWCDNVVWYGLHSSSHCFEFINYREYIMSMELHTLRAVKITQNIFELNRVNRELVAVRKIVVELEIRKDELMNL
jgi:hypothetical protein